MAKHYGVMTFEYVYPLDDEVIHDLDYEKLRKVMLRKMVANLRSFIILDECDELERYFSFYVEDIPY